MRELATADRIREFMRRLGDRARRDTRVYLTGGATAVLLGWRETTIDYDLHAQALSKIERGHAQDLHDVREMLSRGVVGPRTLRELFEAIRPDLIRYPAIDPDSFARKVDEALAGPGADATRRSSG